ncbi:MAG: CPBP family intramembrane metalloprotease [Cellulosilyticum sp.]|nr:CPBP family intramembrane metalloprotease [Cellulosilyticum sp.]
MKQIKAFGQSILVVIWFYVISLLGGLLVEILCPNPISFYERHSYLLNVICYTIIFVGLYSIDQHKTEFREGLKNQKVKDVFKYILMGLGTYFIGTLLVRLLIGFFPEYEEINQSFTAYEPVFRFIAMVILPPIVEEYLFRQKIQGYLKEGFGLPIALIGQALLFGGLHYYMVQKIYAAVLGLIFGIVKEKKGISATICMHMTVNGIGWLMGCMLNY